MPFPSEEPESVDILSATTGSIHVQSYRNGEIWLGITESSDPHSAPSVVTQLTERQRDTLIELLEVNRDVCNVCGGDLVCADCD